MRERDPLPDHPAKFSPAILDRLRQAIKAEQRRLGRPPWVFDPFAGVGRVHQLVPAGTTLGFEIQRRWADCHSRTMWANSLRLPFAPGTFDVIATSPCLAQHQRVLTDDLRWVPAGDVEAGDRLLAFDEATGQPLNGMGTRRRWRRAEVVRSVPRSVECVRVILANGDEIVTTPEHPWLAQRYAYGGTRAEWVASRDLMGVAGAAGRGRAGRRQPYYVQRQVEPWNTRRTYDAGWLAGMFDGEGSLSLGVHGCPKLAMSQVLGPVIDRAEMLMQAFGYEPNRIVRKGTPEHRQEVGNLYVTGGFPGLLRALGELRPTRLLAKWENLDVATRTVEATKVAVLAVEPAGRFDIQEIETTTGTYFGEGYLHHNCYGNRFADHFNPTGKCRACAGTGIVAHTGRGSDGFDACEPCKGTGKREHHRRSYRFVYGEDLDPESAATLQWGPAYRDFHRRAWPGIVEVLAPGGLFLLNVSDHYRDKRYRHVVAFHALELGRCGLDWEDDWAVETDRMTEGENADLRADHEVILALRKPEAVAQTAEGDVVEAITGDGVERFCARHLAPLPCPCGVA